MGGTWNGDKLGVPVDKAVFENIYIYINMHLFLISFSLFVCVCVCFFVTVATYFRVMHNFM